MVDDQPSIENSTVASLIIVMATILAVYLISRLRLRKRENKATECVVTLHDISQKQRPRRVIKPLITLVDIKNNQQAERAEEILISPHLMEQLIKAPTHGRSDYSEKFSCCIC